MHSQVTAAYKSALTLVETAGEQEPQLDQQSEVLRLEHLLGRIFNDEIERALVSESQNPVLVQAQPQQESAQAKEIDFAPFFEESRIEESSIVEILEPRSIIEADDELLQVEINSLNYVVEYQRKELTKLREIVRQTRDHSRRLALDLAAKDDELRSLPELLTAPLIAEIELEKLAHSQTAAYLTDSQNTLAQLNASIWVRLGRFFGLK